MPPTLIFLPWLIQPLKQCDTMPHAPSWHTVLSVAPLMKLQGSSAGINANRQLQRVSQGLLTWGWSRAGKKTPKTSPKTKRKHRKRWEVNIFLRTSCISQSKTSHWAHMWLCAWKGRHYWWHIYNRKWFGALWTHSLKRLIDCGGWLTLEGRQPVSLTFSLNLWSLLVRALSEGGKRRIFVLTWESQEVRGTWPHPRCIISNAQKWCLTDDLKVFQLFRLMVKYEVCFVE